MEHVRVMVVEDQPRVLKAVVKLLEAAPEVAVVAAAASGEQALARLAAPWPDGAPEVVLMDLELPGIDGVATTRAMRERAPAALDVLVLTSFEDEDRVFEAMRAGASGYLVKGAPPEKIVAAILDVAAGGTVVEPRLAKRFWNYFRGLDVAKGASEPKLTDAELEILRFVAKGLTNAEVGAAIGAPRRSVRTMLGHIYEKLGARSHVEAVVIALKKGLVEL